MFKLVVLSVIIALAAARPGFLGHLDAPLTYAAAPILHQDYVQVHQPIVTKVGAYVESIPTAVSHQSSTVVHNKGHIVTPVLAPAVKTYVTPVLNTYSAPLLNAYSSPLLYGYGHHH